MMSSYDSSMVDDDDFKLFFKILKSVCIHIKRCKRL